MKTIDELLQEKIIKQRKQEDRKKAKYAKRIRDFMEGKT